MIVRYLLLLVSILLQHLAVSLLPKSKNNHETRSTHQEASGNFLAGFRHGQVGDADDSSSTRLAHSEMIESEKYPQIDERRRNVLEIMGDDIHGGAVNDNFGHAVALSADGKIIAVGATDYVRIYSTNGTWQPIGNDILDDDDGDNNNNQYVCISDDGRIVAIGYSQHVQIVEWDGSDWNRKDEILVRANSTISSIALSGDGSGVAIGFLNDNTITTGSNSLGVKISNWKNGSLTDLGDDIMREEAVGESGYVAISQDGFIVAVCSPSYESNSGAVRLYQWDGMVWNRLGPDYLQGATVDISSDGMMIAIMLSDDVRVFELKDGNWQQRGQGIMAELDGHRYGPSTLSISGDGSILSFGTRHKNYDIVYLRIFHFDGETWWQVGCDIVGDDGNAPFDWSISLSRDGSTAAAGDPFSDGLGKNQPSSGHVRVFAVDLTAAALACNECWKDFEQRFGVSSCDDSPDSPDSPGSESSSTSQWGFVSFIGGITAALGILIGWWAHRQVNQRQRALAATRQIMVERRRQQSQHATPPTVLRNARFEQILTKFHSQTVLPDRSNTTPEMLRATEDQNLPPLQAQEEEENTTGNALSDRFANKRKPSNKDECCICLDGYHPGETICIAATHECNHVFHQDCVAEWLQENDQCPLCRVDLMAS